MPYKSVKIFSRKLAALIEQRNKSVAGTARAVGVEPQSVWAWLKKPVLVGVRPDAFDKLVKYLEVTPEELKANGAPPNDDAIDIPMTPDLRARLNRIAKTVGKSPEDLALDFIREGIAEDLKKLGVESASELPKRRRAAKDTDR